MTKKTMTAEEREWEASREARHQWTLRLLNSQWREVQERQSQPESTVRRRLFPWRIRIERLG